ncbi:MAG: hypothetical protein KFW09_00895 [Oscillospiraceae bacterium]|nr:hypothetical protein [Oscillospiraceae bacterium]
MKKNKIIKYHKNVIPLNFPAINTNNFKHEMSKPIQHENIEIMKNEVDSNEK